MEAIPYLLLKQEKKRKMKAITNLIIVFLLSSSLALYAQTYSNPNNNTGFEDIQNKATQLSLVAAQNVNPRSNRNQSVSNKVFVQQLGNFNSINTTVRSLISDVNLLQLGENNDIGLDLSAGIIDKTVVQRGQNNSFIGLSLGQQVIHRGAALQQGRNQNLIWLGSNSISDRMTIRMSGNNQTILVRNIKR